jgi:hypothetical protein
MNKSEQKIWSNTLTNQSENLNSKTMTIYLRIISYKLSQTNFHSEMNNVCMYILIMNREKEVFI